MSPSYFLDTNIFVYSLDRTAAAKSKIASELIRDAITNRRGVVSYQVVQEFFNVALRRFTPPMSFPDAERYLSAVFRPLLAVHSSPALYLQALRFHEEHTLSWNDALIVAAAIEAKCSVLFSEDLQNGRRFGALQIKNPFL